MDLFVKPDIPAELTSSPTKHVVICNDCGTARRYPLEIFEKNAVQDYGIGYYSQMKVDEQTRASAIIRHATIGQMPHYITLRDLLLARGMGGGRWLDIGSAGGPTSFDDFEFTTVEPDPITVAVGRKLYHPDRIIQGTLETVTLDPGFDGVVFLNSLYCTPTPNEAFAKAASLLRDGGHLLIGISSYMMDTVMPDVPFYARIEDVIRGDVYWILYSVPSLRHIAARHGFRLVDEEIRGHLRFCFFVKDQTSSEAPSVAECKAYNDARWASLFDHFTAITLRSLAGIDRATTAILAPKHMFNEIAEVYPVRRATVFIDLDVPDSECAVEIDGRTFLPIQQVSALFAKGQIIEIAALTFKRQDDAVRLIAEHMPKALGALKIPTRTSGFEHLVMPIAGQRRPVKGLMFKRLD